MRLTNSIINLAKNCVFIDENHLHIERFLQAHFAYKSVFLNIRFGILVLNPKDLNLGYSIEIKLC